MLPRHQTMSRYLSSSKLARPVAQRMTRTTMSVFVPAFAFWCNGMCCGAVAASLLPCRCGAAASDRSDRTLDDHLVDHLSVENSDRGLGVAHGEAAQWPR